jgi:hypothetical protein
MHLFRRRAFLFLIVWVASFSTSVLPAAVPQTPDSTPRVKVSLFDDAHVPSAALAQARDRASAIFSHAGIEVDWLVCEPANPTDFSPSRTPCSDVAWPTHLSVRIIPHGRTVAADVFGQAFVDDSGQGIYSNVYYQNLVSSPNHPGIADGDMLGLVIAHELGHLLLGTNSHSHDGLMQAKWSPHILADMPHVLLIFTSAQSTVIHSRLSAFLQAKATLRGASPATRAICSLM